VVISCAYVTERYIMTEPREQGHVPYTLSFELPGKIAEAMPELKDKYDLSDEQLAIYGLGVLRALARRERETGAQQRIFLGSDYNDPNALLLASPQEALALGFFDDSGSVAG
jgi:hypothetical protein